MPTWAPTTPNAYEQRIDSQTPTGTVCTFSSIPQIYTHLLIRGLARGSAAANAVLLGLTFNSDTGATNYLWQYIAGVGSLAAAAEDTGDPNILAGVIPANTAPANSAGPAEIWVPNYRTTSFHKVARCISSRREATGANGLALSEVHGVWLSTAAITRIDLTPSSGNFSSPSRFDLYGIM